MATACRTRASWNRGRRSHPRSATTGSVWWEHVGTPSSLVDGCGGAPFSELSARFLFSVSSAAFYLRCLSPYITLGYQLSNQVIKEILMRLVWHIQCDLKPPERPVFFIFLTQSILDLFDEMTSRVRYKAASLCISYCWYHRENIRLLFYDWNHFRSLSGTSSPGWPWGQRLDSPEWWPTPWSTARPKRSWSSSARRFNPYISKILGNIFQQIVPHEHRIWHVEQPSRKASTSGRFRRTSLWE